MPKIFSNWCAVRRTGIVLLSASGIAFGQSSTPIALQDQSALVVAARSLAAMRGPGISTDQVVVLVGTLAVHGTTYRSFPITLKLHGTTDLRSELQTPSGTRITVVSNGVSGILSPQGKTRMLSTKNSAGYRNEFLPAMSILSEFNAPTMTIEHLGTSLIDNTAHDVIGIGSAPASGTPISANGVAPSRSLFYVNSNTGLVSRMQTLHFSENEADTSEQVEIRYSDYRQIDGVMVPFHQETYIDGSLQMDLSLTSASFGNAFSVSDFSIGK